MHCPPMPQLPSTAKHPTRLPETSRKHSRTHTLLSPLQECFISMADEMKEQESCKQANLSVSLGPCQVSFSSSQHLSHQPEPSQAALRDQCANGFQVLQQGMEEEHREGSLSFPPLSLMKSPQLAPGSALKHTFQCMTPISRLPSMLF